MHINVEAYPDPAPAIIEVVAQYPGASAEEVERLVTIPLEVALAGHARAAVDAEQVALRPRLPQLPVRLRHRLPRRPARKSSTACRWPTSPTGVTPPISPRSPIGEIFRYTLSNPKDALGRPVYSLHDLKTLQNWTLVREFRRLPGVVDVVSFGGDVKRYEVHPDPERLKRYGITLKQLQEAIAASNANVGGDYLVQGETVQVVRGLGLIGQGQDPAQAALGDERPGRRPATTSGPRSGGGFARSGRSSSPRPTTCRSASRTSSTAGRSRPGRRSASGASSSGRETRLGRVILSRPSRRRARRRSRRRRRAGPGSTRTTPSRAS